MSLAGNAAGAVVASVPALLAASAINGMGASKAGTVASVACPRRPMKQVAPLVLLQGLPRHSSSSQ
eukprot:6203217-Pyramimonas_sp.AAC.1